MLSIKRCLLLALTEVSSPVRSEALGRSWQLVLLLLLMLRVLYIFLVAYCAMTYHIVLGEAVRVLVVVYEYVIEVN